MNKDTFIANLAYINMRKDIWSTTVNTLLIGTLAACQANGGFSPTISPEPGGQNNPNTLTIDPPETEIAKVTTAILTEVNNQTQKDATVASLPQDRPTTKDGDKNISVYSMKVGDVDFKMASYFLTDEQIQKQIKDGLVFTNPSSGENWTPDSILYMAVVNGNGEFEWGLHLPVIAPETPDRIRWAYVSSFPKNASEMTKSSYAETLSYNSDLTNGIFIPLISEPYNTIPDFIPGYVSDTQLTVLMKDIKAGGALFAPAKIDAESPLPEGPIADLQKQIGDKFKITQGEGETFVIKGMENLKFNADGTAELSFNDEKLTVAKQVILPDGDNLNIGPWQLDKEGEVTMLVAGAPKTVEEAKLLPRQALIQGHSKWTEMDRTNRLYDQWSTAKGNNYDPLDEFKGIIVDGKEVELTDIVPEFIVGSVPGNNAPISIGGDGANIYYPTASIALGQGWSALEIYDVNGNKVYDLINVPIVNLTPDSSVVVTNGLLNRDKFSEMKTYLSNEERVRIESEIISGEVVHPITIQQLFSDVKLREFMFTYNEKFLKLNIIQEDMMQLPPELSTMVYFDFEQRPK